MACSSQGDKHLNLLYGFQLGARYCWSLLVVVVHQLPDAFSGEHQVLLVVCAAAPWEFTERVCRDKTQSVGHGVFANFGALCCQKRICAAEKVEENPWHFDWWINEFEGYRKFYDHWNSGSQYGSMQNTSHAKVVSVKLCIAGLSQPVDSYLYGEQVNMATMASVATRFYCNRIDWKRKGFVAGLKQKVILTGLEDQFAVVHACKCLWWYLRWSLDSLCLSM